MNFSKLRRLQAKTKCMNICPVTSCSTTTTVLSMIAPTHIQGSVNLFSNACKNFGLTVSTKKTGVLHQPASASHYIEHYITVNGQ